MQPHDAVDTAAQQLGDVQIGTKSGQLALDPKSQSQDRDGRPFGSTG